MRAAAGRLHRRLQAAALSPSPSTTPSTPVSSAFSSAAAQTYDVVVVGGGVMGSSVAYHLAIADPTMRIAVVERDPRYTHASAMLSAGGIRHQFSLAANIGMSLYGSEFLRDAPERLRVSGADDDAIDLQFKEQGYLFLSSEAGEPTLRQNQATQASCGVDWTHLMEPDALRERFPWLDTDGDADMEKAAITLGCLGTAHEGWFDPWALLNGMRSKARELGVEYHHGTVMGMTMDSSASTPTISGVVVSGSESGTDQHLTLEAGEVVCAAGAWAASVVGMCGDAAAVTPLPVAPRKRCIFTFHCPEEGVPDGKTTPLTVLPETGVYFRPEGAPGNFLCGVSPDADDDPDITVEDLDHVAHHLFDEVIWPSLYKYAPVFGNIKVTSCWAGFYEYNTLDQNGIIGRHPDVCNLMLVNGFSGHGLQQSPAAGRGVAELLVHGSYQTADLSCFGFERITEGKPVFEQNIV